MRRAKEIIRSRREVIGVTGSSGFVGNRLVERLTQKGYEVARMDREGNVAPDVTTIYDCASYGNIFNQTEPELIYKANVERVVELLSNAQGRTVVLTSSSSVLLPTQTKYSESKARMESIASLWAKEMNENVIIARPSTIVGVGDNNAHLVPKLIHSAFTQEPMDFVGEPMHDYIDVDDYIDGLFVLARNAEKHKGEVFNVSFGVSVSNEFVKDIVADTVGSEPNIKRVKSLRKYDTIDWKVPSEKLRALRWLPKKTIIVSIAEMVKDYERRNNTNI